MNQKVFKRRVYFSGILLIIISFIFIVRLTTLHFSNKIIIKQKKTIETRRGYIKDRNGFILEVMKHLWILALVMQCITGFPQEGELPRAVESAFQLKYTDTPIGDWWLENQLYYIDFKLRGASYTAVFDGQGTWKETAQIFPLEGFVIASR